MSHNTMVYWYVCISPFRVRPQHICSSATWLEPDNLSCVNILAARTSQHLGQCLPWFHLKIHITKVIPLSSVTRVLVKLLGGGRGFGVPRLTTGVPEKKTQCAVVGRICCPPSQFAHVGRQHCSRGKKSASPKCSRGCVITN